MHHGNSGKSEDEVTPLPAKVFTLALLLSERSSSANGSSFFGTPSNGTIAHHWEVSALCLSCDQPRRLLRLMSLTQIFQQQTHFSFFFFFFCPLRSQFENSKSSMKSEVNPRLLVINHTFLVYFSGWWRGDVQRKEGGGVIVKMKIKETLPPSSTQSLGGFAWRILRKMNRCATASEHSQHCVWTLSVALFFSASVVACLLKSHASIFNLG